MTHGYPWRDFLDGNKLTLRDDMWAPFADSNLMLEVCFPVRLGDKFAFPYTECQPALAAMLEHIGPDRLLWGTDMPFQNRFCTYRQSRQYLELIGETLLTPADRAKIMGGNVAAIFGLV